MIVAIYEWPPLAAFLAAVMGKPALHVMADPLARLNVMAYRAGEALNWHFDRSEFTTTLLLQAPEAGARSARADHRRLLLLRAAGRHVLDRRASGLLRARGLTQCDPIEIAGRGVQRIANDYLIGIG